MSTCVTFRQRIVCLVGTLIDTRFSIFPAVSLKNQPKNRRPEKKPVKSSTRTMFVFPESSVTRALGRTIQYFNDIYHVRQRCYSVARNRSSLLSNRPADAVTSTAERFQSYTRITLIAIRSIPVRVSVFDRFYDGPTAFPWRSHARFLHTHTRRRRDALTAAGYTNRVRQQ